MSPYWPKGQSESIHDDILLPTVHGNEAWRWLEAVNSVELIALKAGLWHVRDPAAPLPEEGGREPGRVPEAIFALGREGTDGDTRREALAWGLAPARI
jgi:hypothetical protein